MTIRFAAVAAIAGLLLPVAGARADEPAPTERHHVATVQGHRLPYTASFERFAVAPPTGGAGARITTVAYLRDRPDPARPVVFAFNGGPGVASIFLNVGVLGPRRVDLPSDPRAAIPPVTALVANQDSILDVADIVLIDPVGTGFSRLLDPAAAGYFYSVKGDAKAVADAIVAWTRAHGRRASPKYVLGESYGATRAVLVAANLRQVPDTTDLGGVVLLSQSLQIIDTVQRRSNIVGQAVGMPTIAVTAWYHGLAGQGQARDAFVAQAAAFARERWLPALMAGTALPDDARRRVAEGLSRYTGLTADYFIAHDLYLTKEDYRRLALADRRQMLGLYDTRYVGRAGAIGNPDDVLLAAIRQGGDVMWREQFGIDAARFRQPANGAEAPIAANWIYARQPFAPTAGSDYRQIDYVADLLALMAQKPDLRLMVTAGWYDTAASAGADDWLLSRPGLDTGRVTVRRYGAGHMFYTDPASRTAFAATLRTFLSGRGR